MKLDRKIIAGGKRAQRATTYVDFLMAEWGIGERRRLQTIVRKILTELCAEALLSLKDARLEVMILPDADFTVWAYFPIHRRRLIAKKLRLKPQTKVLLVLSPDGFTKEPVKTVEAYLRDHLGHVLLYLRAPKARNGCADAMKEWRRSVYKTPAQTHHSNIGKHPLIPPSKISTTSAKHLHKFKGGVTK
jgi:hypothetical protein